MRRSLRDTVLETPAIRVFVNYQDLPGDDRVGWQEPLLGIVGLRVVREGTIPGLHGYADIVVQHVHTKLTSPEGVQIELTLVIQTERKRTAAELGKLLQEGIARTRRWWAEVYLPAVAHGRMTVNQKIPAARTEECDFCGGFPAPWAFPCPDHQDPGGQINVGAWAACEECRQDIEAGRENGPVDRFVIHILAKHPEQAGERDFFRRHAERAHGAFWTVRHGIPEEYGLPAVPIDEMRRRQLEERE